MESDLDKFARLLQSTVDREVSNMHTAILKGDLESVKSSWDELDKINFLGDGFKKVFTLFCADMFMAAVKTRNEQNLDSKTFTYIFRSGDSNKYKIGKTRTGVENRRKTLRGMNSEDLFLVITLKANVENELHKKYATKRLHGEWFELSEEDLIEIQEYATLLEPTN